MSGQMRLGMLQASTEPEIKKAIKQREKAFLKNQFKAWKKYRLVMHAVRFRWHSAHLPDAAPRVASGQCRVIGKDSVPHPRLDHRIG